MKVINVLGTEYEITEMEKSKDPGLKDYLGYCDGSVKKIVVDDMRYTKNDALALGNIDSVKQDTLRHKIVHAFMNESGLKNECPWKQEEMVDWVAVQFPKMMQAMVSCDALKSCDPILEEKYNELHDRFNHLLESEYIRSFDEAYHFESEEGKRSYDGYARNILDADMENADWIKYHGRR